MFNSTSRHPCYYTQQPTFDDAQTQDAFQELLQKHPDFLPQNGEYATLSKRKVASEFFNLTPHHLEKSYAKTLLLVEGAKPTQTTQTCHFSLYKENSKESYQIQTLAEGEQAWLDATQEAFLALAEQRTLALKAAMLPEAVALFMQDRSRVYIAKSTAYLTIKSIEMTFSFSKGLVQNATMCRIHLWCQLDLQHALLSLSFLTYPDHNKETAHNMTMLLNAMFAAARPNTEIPSVTTDYNRKYGALADIYTFEAYVEDNTLVVFYQGERVGKLPNFSHFQPSIVTLGV